MAPTQKTSRLPGGDLRIEFDATGLTEVVGWVLRWGSAAVVREPDELKKRVRDELARGLERYGGGDAAG
ncbi:MAG: WYL domain-containing protein [Deltaproteobacteria bacterium]|nr:WYL domain-containing protein [Deltaproteobacteria bacterium]